VSFSHLKFETQTKLILLPWQSICSSPDAESRVCRFSRVQTWPFALGTKAQVHPALSSEIQAAVSTRSLVNSSSRNKTLIPNSAQPVSFWEKGLACRLIYGLTQQKILPIGQVWWGHWQGNNDEAFDGKFPIFQKL